MSRLRVGDIHIDGANVVIAPGAVHVHRHTQTPAGSFSQSVVVVGHAPPAARPALEAVRVPPLARAGDWPARIPVSPRALFTAGVAGAAASIAAGVVMLAAGAELLAPLAIVPLSCLGLGGLVLGLLKKRAIRRRAAEDTERAERLLDARIERLKPVLGGADTTHTVEWLRQQTGMTEDVVVSTLHALVQRGRVTEEVCVDTGEWYYFWNAAEDDRRRYLPVAERVALKEGAKK